MNWGLVRTIIVLPGTIVVLVPIVILTLTKSSKFSPKLTNPSQVLFWFALLAAIMGIGLSAWSAKLFIKFGNGTPAPWDPPKTLVLHGPYLYVRNPMITGVLFILLAEAIIFQSIPLAFWMIVFFIGKSIYFTLIEEKSLEKRFGINYQEYKKHVPRWIPRLSMWKRNNK